MVTEQPFGDRRDLFDRLAGAEEDFRKALAQAPVAVQGREAQLLEWQDLQPFEGVLGGELPLSDRLQDCPHPCPIHNRVPWNSPEG